MATPSHSSPSSSTRGKAPPKSLHDYQLGDSLGKGAFGQVYRALNWATGETVAVKEIQLSNIPKSELGEIMSEIDLLKNLNHPNIVKYKGFVKTREYLYIILEFCENGSLHAISKRFGKFPENLVGVYIYQVLEGLVYLHDQGVIHRDIKGANILTNKDGSVKLADFGVASSTTTGAVSNDTVVGSPYWMAPEVIEQSGATTASDIWSVGCVVIELLEGNPPYYNLSPMPALFRIVQDDCPPIPEGASSIVKDFLYHCFQKDVNLRISAKKLLKHPWMISTRKRMVEGREPQSAGQEGGRRPLSNYNYDEAVLKVQEWNEALKSPSRPSKHLNRSSRTAERPVSPTRRHLDIGMSSARLSQAISTGNGPSPRLGGTPSPSTSVPINLAEKIQPLQFAQPEEQTDNWDDDFEEGISFTKLQGQSSAQPSPHSCSTVPLALDKTSADDDKQEIDDKSKTIKPNRSPNASERIVAKPPSSGINPIVEDYSDLASEEDELESKVANFKMKNSFRKGLFHPDDIQTIGLSFQNVSPGPRTAPLPEMNEKRRRPTVSTMTPTSGKVSPGPMSTTLRNSHGRSSSFAGVGGSMGRAESRGIHVVSEFDKYAESDDEDYDDIFGKPNGTGAEQSETLQLNTRLSNKSWLGDDLSDEEDPFAEIDEGFDEDDLESNLQRDKYARLCNTVNSLIDELTPSAPDFQLQEACGQILNIMADAPEMQMQLVSSHGMLAILEVLEGKCSREVIMTLLQIINLLVTADIGFLESFCLIGGIPIMMGFTSKKYPSDCRLQASNFIRLLCHTSVLTLQMFISCRGLKILVDLLDEDYTEQTELVVHALNGIGSVFELQSPTTKNDFCRMFIREGLLDPLSSALLNVMAGRGGTSTEMKMKIIQILLVFSQVSQSDIHVRQALGTRKVVRRLLRACELLEPECLVQLLKAVKHLSMNSTMLDVLQNANAIEILVRIMEEQNGPHSTEMCNHIIQICYNLCRLNKSRQEEAAQAGIIPLLKRVTDTSSPLKQLALPILCDLASAGKGCRKMLWQYDGLAMYLKLLNDPYFQGSALEAVLSWLQDETARVEDELAKPESIALLLDCFVTSKAVSFENILDPLLKIIRLSSSITIALTKSPSFFKRIVDRLSHNSKAVVRLNLLRILRTVCEVHPNRTMLVEKYGLLGVVENLSRGGGDGAVLVRELAREIVPTLRPALHPINGLDGSPRATIAPKRMRRTASDTSSLTFGTARASVASGIGRPARQRLGDIQWHQKEGSTRR